MPTEIASKAAVDLAHEVVARRASRRERRRADFIEKFDRYMAATTILANDLASVKSNVPRGRVGRVLASPARLFDGLTSEHEDEVLGRVLFRRHFERQDDRLAEWIEAQTRLGTIAPVRVREAVVVVSEVLIRWSQTPGPGLVDEWLEARKALQRAGDDYLRPGWKRWLRRGWATHRPLTG